MQILIHREEEEQLPATMHHIQRKLRCGLPAQSAHGIFLEEFNGPVRGDRAY